METLVDSPSHEVIVARDAAEIDALRDAWMMLQAQQECPIFNAEPDRLLSLVRWQHEARPHVILLKKEGTPVAMVVGSIERVRIHCRLGYKTFLLPPLKCFTVIHRGLLGTIDDETSAVLLEEIGKLLKSAETDLVFFHYLKADSPFLRVARAKVPGLCRSHFNRMDVHRTMTLPDSMEAFYQSCSKKHRANLRRYVRRIEEQYGERAVVVRYLGEDGIDSFLEAASDVSAKTYQQALGSGLGKDERTQDLLQQVAEEGWLRSYVLFLDGTPCAFQHGAAYRGSYFLEQIGFNPKWKDFNVGTVLFLKALEDLCRDRNGTRTIDFGFGEADYKRSYGDRCWNDVRFYLFAPRVRPILANLVFSGTTGLSAGLTCVLEKTGFIRRIKRLWRDRLRQKEGESAE
jgi:CelD/BcsL family acetyltransferase involved in cellulose biosynthesis